MTILRIPLEPIAQRFFVALNGVVYECTLQFADVDEGGWFLDIATSDGVMLAAGLPLVTGADILAQFRYLNIIPENAVLYTYTDGDISAPPTYDNLGSAANLYYEVTDGT